jgi:integrase
MTKKIERLNAVSVRNAGPGMHCDGGNLYLQVTEAPDRTLRKSWVLRFATGRTVTSANGKQRREERQMGLGSLTAVSLAEARLEAERYRAELAKGNDPIELRRAAEAQRTALKETKTKTFDECAEACISGRLAGWRNPKHADQWRNTLKTYASPVLGKLPVRDIDTEAVRKVLDPIWRVKPETADRVRGRIEAVLNWSRVNRFREGENPARWRGHLDQTFPAKSKVRRVRHHTALPYAELPSFMGALRLQDGTGARALEFTILTAARTNKTIGAKWAEIDMQAKVWTVPGERMKGGREHRVPLSASAMAILRRQAERKENEFVFPGDRRAGLSNMTLLMTLRRMGRDDLTVHGFRSTFKDWGEDETTFGRELIEAALAHVIGDKAEQAYRRADALEKRRKLMTAWGEYCSKAATGTVVPLRVG